MPFIAAVLSVLLATQSQAPKTDPQLQREIVAFIGHLKASRMPEAYAFMAEGAKKVIGRAQFAAYVASRTRALGRIIDVSNIRVSDVVEMEHGMSLYEADVRFEEGMSRAWFVLTREAAGWRLQKFGLHLPQDAPATFEPTEMLLVVRELLAVVQHEGAPALADRFSEEELAAVDQTREMAREAFTMLHALLGRLRSYTLGTPTDDDEPMCQTVLGEGTFEHGSAPLVVRLCWDDGVWRLRHAQMTPPMTPPILERSIAYALRGEATVRCPRDAEFPIGGEVVCRVAQRGQPQQDATVRRTSESGWEIVALKPAKE
jgi:hypothetical protein